ncbi:MAG: hypothetical protein K5945_07400 [Bacteroidaceae bacterium]|nr:hypothetical protein [Bacteroidaceae bacterium]
MELYTDTEGHRILIEQLRLPYSRIHVVLDDFDCLPFHWALAKIKTYSLQETPFVHVDGDIYLPNPLKAEMFDANLVTQNREIGTLYYRRMMDRILAEKEITLPDIAQRAVRKDSLASYNMGFFGGKNLDFIRRYCNLAFQFVEDNHLNDLKYRHVSLDCNVFFEQMLFALMADEEHQKVESVLGREMEDQGYTGREFCDFINFEKTPFLHLLGGHKRNQYQCEMLEKTLLRFYPDFHRRIMSLFPEKHIRFDQGFNEKKLSQDDMPTEDYGTFLSDAREVWNNISLNQLYEWAEKNSQFFNFITASTAAQLNTLMEANPYIAYYEIPRECGEDIVEKFRKRLKCEPFFPLRWIAVIPSLRDSGIKEFAALDDEFLILQRLKEGQFSVQYLQKYIYPESEEHPISIQRHLYEGIKTLLHHGLLAVANS